MVRAALLFEKREADWSSLFLGSDFFTKHSNYLQISIRANNSEDFLKWLRLCESRLRLLITSLETPQTTAWPFAKFFHRKYTKAGVIASGDQEGHQDCLHESLFFIALRFAPGVDTINLRYCTSDFLHKVNSWEERKEGMDLSLAHALQSDLPGFIHDEIAEVASSVPSEVQALTTSETPKLRHGAPSNADKSTRLTPKLSRSTISDLDMASPAKRARNGLS
jgi:poly(A) polymerase